jgi:TolB-like protein/Flp pilus assembly protein TadD
MPAVFISYASQDTAVAHAVVGALEGDGLSCWIAPRDVTPGAFYGDAIVHAIDAAQAVVLILSGSAAASPHILREIERAGSKRHPVISLRIDRAPLPAGLEYFLNTSQWLDASEAEPAGAFPRLVEAVRGIVAVAVGGEHSAATPSPQSSARPPASGSQDRRVLDRRWILLGALIVVAIAGLAGIRYWQRPPLIVAPASLPGRPATAMSGPETPTAIPEKSVAVLPFADMSEKKDQEYFADGTAEEILNLLAKVPGLHVPARTSSFYFKGKSEDIPTIARRLNVADVLEGSVRKSGNRVRITVQLVRADNGYHLWSETYDRTLDDIFKVQDEIAAEVVKALKVSLGENDIPRAVTIENSQAHALLLQARFFAERQTREDLARAVDCYRQVIQLDPDSATAWAELSMSLTFIWNNGLLGRDRTVQQQRTLALQAAERAVAIDPNLGVSHEAMAEIRYWFDWDFTGADAEVDRARALDPGSTTALTQAAVLALLHGRPTDALRLLQQAVLLDPLNPDAHIYLAELYYILGRFTEAEVLARKAVDLAPMEPGSHVPLVRMLLALGRQDDALAEVLKESDPGWRAYSVARAYTVLGRKAAADAALSELERTFAGQLPYNIATLHALRGELDQAFLWLDRAYGQHDPNVIAIPPFTIDKDMQNLRGDPRYKTFLRKMKLPE